MKRVHIVGCVRSGTSLMMSCMASCFRHDGACAHEMTLFKEPEGDPGLFISKQPSDIKRVGLVLDGNPSLFVIYMERDPRSVIASIHPIDLEKYFADFSCWEVADRAARPWFGHPRFLRILYEDFVRDPNGTQQAIMDAYPFLEKTHDFSEFEKFAEPSFKADEAMGGKRPIGADRIEGWKLHLPRIKAQVARHPKMVPLLVERGREPDDGWLKMLEDVAPSPTLSYYAERSHPLQGFERKIRYWLKTRKYLARHGS